MPSATWYREINPTSEPQDMRRLDAAGRIQWFFNVDTIKGYSTTFADEIVAILVAASVGTLDSTIFVSSGINVPDTDTPILVLTETGGTSPERTQNSIATPAYQRPSMSIVAKARTTRQARALAQSAYAALVRIRNVDISFTPL